MSLETGEGCVWKEANPKFTGAGTEVLLVKQWHCQWRVCEMFGEKSALCLSGMILSVTLYHLSAEDTFLFSLEIRLIQCLPKAKF